MIVVGFGGGILGVKVSNADPILTEQDNLLWEEESGT